MTPPRRRVPSLALPLALSVALAVALGGVIHLSVTSVPYLATSPTTDPVFGALNACLLARVPERLGFAVARDATAVAAWSSSTLGVCRGAPPTAEDAPLPGVTSAAWDGLGGLWAAAPQGLFRREGGTWVKQGDLAPALLVGTAGGVLALDATGQLMAVAPGGAVTASRALPGARGVRMTASADGALVALSGGGRLSVVRADTLEATPAEVSCSVARTWWRADAPRLIADCVSLVVEVDALTSQSALLEPRRRVPSVLAGPAGVYVQPCDQLPCSAEAPR